METIKTKIKELIKFSNDGEKLSFDKLFEKIKQQDILMKEINVLAKEEKTILGRIIKFPVADSYAMYVINKLNKKTVRIQWLNYCDGWVDDRCGEEANLDLSYISAIVSREDTLAKLFS